MNGKCNRKTILAIILLAFAAVALAYPITMQVRANIADFTTTVIKCNDAACSSLNLSVRQDIDSGTNTNEYVITDSGTQYYAEYDWKACYASPLYMNSFNDGTGGGPWLYDITLAAKQNCNATINSVSYSTATPNEGQAVTITVNARSAFSYPAGGPATFPADLTDIYSADTSVNVVVRNSANTVVFNQTQTISPTINSSMNAPFVWTPTIQDNYTVQTTTRVTDCQCDAATMQPQTQAGPSNISVQNLVPTADAGGPYVTNEGSAVNFVGSAVSGNAPYTWAWDLDNDGLFDESTEQNSSATWTDDIAGGIVWLRVTDNDGDTSIDSAALTINNVAPTANAGGPYTCNEGDNIVLAGSAFDPSPEVLSYVWDLDNDGAYDDSAIQNPNYACVANGVYPIALRVSDDDLGSGTNATTVTVKDYSVDIWPATNAQTIELLENAVYNVFVNNTGEVADNYTLTVQNIDGVDQAQLNSTATPLLNPAVIYTLSLTVRDSNPGVYRTTATATSPNANDVTVIITTTVTTSDTGWIYNSTVNGTFYVNQSTGIYSSINDSFIINNSTIIASDPANFSNLVQIINSTIDNTTVEDSFISLTNATRSLINDSIVIGSAINDSRIVRSNVTNSTIINSNITDSTITRSNITNSSITLSTIIDSTVINSVLNNVTATNSYVFNSTLSNMILIGANVTSNILYNGVVIIGNMQYNATGNLPLDLSNPSTWPAVTLAYTPSSITTATAVTFNATITGQFDVNTTLTYEWDFENDGTIDSTGWNSSSASKTYNTAGTYTARVKVTDGHNSSAITTTVLTVAAAPSSPSGGGSGGGGGNWGGNVGPAQPADDRAKFIWIEMTPSQGYEAKIDLAKVAITSIKFTINETIKKAEIVLKRIYNETQPWINESKIYQYIALNATPGEKMRNIEIFFKVNNSWLEANGFDKEAVELSRYHDKTLLEHLYTIKLRENGNYTEYKASAANFSDISYTFIISPTKPVPKPLEPQPPQNETNQTVQTRCEYAFAEMRGREPTTVATDAACSSVTKLVIIPSSTLNDVKIRVVNASLGYVESTTKLANYATQYFEISATRNGEPLATSDIESIGMTFIISKAVITERGFELPSISLVRWNDNWQPLPTAKIAEDETTVTYEAIGDKLGLYGVSGETRIHPVLIIAAIIAAIIIIASILFVKLKLIGHVIKID